MSSPDSHTRRPRFRKHRRHSRRLTAFLDQQSAKYDGYQTTIQVDLVDSTLQIASTASGIAYGPLTCSGVVPTELRSKQFWVDPSDSGGNDFVTLYHTRLDLGANDSAYALTAWDLAPDVESVSAGNDTLTITDHAMVTGDGPFQMTTTDTLPAGISLTTDYWVARVDDDTFRVATSLANALASGVVNITDGGTGTHTVNRDLYIMKDLSADGILEYLAQGVRPIEMVDGVVADVETIFDK